MPGLGHKCSEWESPIYWKRVGRLQGVWERRKEKECNSFHVVKQFCASEARESLSLQHVDKDHKAVGFKYLSLSFFFSPQSLGAAIDSRGDFLGQGQEDWHFWGKPEFVAPVNSGNWTSPRSTLVSVGHLCLIALYTIALFLIMWLLCWFCGGECVAHDSFVCVFPMSYVMLFTAIAL